MKTVLKIRNTLLDRSSTDGRVDYYPAERVKAPRDEFKDDEDHPGWAFYSGFSKVVMSKVSLNKEDLWGYEARNCFIQRFGEKSDDPFVLLLIKAWETLDGEPVCILVNTTAFLLNDQGQTIERLR